MKKRPLMAAALLVVVWLCLCRFLGWMEEIPLPEEASRGFAACEGSVCGIEYSEESQYLYLNHLDVSSNQKIPPKYKIKIITNLDVSISYGNRIKVKGRVLLSEPPTNEGQFDSCAWQRAQNILFTMTNVQITLVNDSRDDLLQLLHEMRQEAMQRLLLLMPKRDAGVLGAMLLGDKTYLEDETKIWYQIGGISHILAISGLHISLIGMAAYRGLRKIGLTFLVSSGAAAVLMIFYALMTGAGTATCRAVIMFVVFLGAQCLGRTYDRTCSLSLAVLLLLFYQPLWLFQAGFQLSVLAVAGLCIIQPTIEETYGNKILSGISIQLVLLPCLLWHYFEVPLYGIFLNLFVLPLVPVGMVCGMLAVFLSFVYLPLAGVLGTGACWILDFFYTLCDISEKLPFSMLIFGRPSAFAVCCWYVVLLGGVSLLGKKKDKITKTIVPMALLAAFCLLPYTEQAELKVSFLDVGQGDCIFVRSRQGMTLLCDGGSSSVSGVGQYRILPFLKSQGIAELDIVFLTHADADHINGIRELLEMEGNGICIQMLVLPDIEQPDESYLEMEALAKQKGTKVRRMTAGEQICAGNFTLTCLHPDKTFQTADKNEDSLAFHMQYGSFDAMLMGDLEGKGEERFLEQWKSGKFGSEDGRIELLKVGHHGSKNATSEELLQALTPQLAVLSYGEGNRYGHPAPETIKRLQTSGCSILSTANCGEISIFCDKNEKITVRYGKDVIE